jgi:hypothetical protein
VGSSPSPSGEYMIRPAAHPPKAWPKDHGSYCPICREFVPAFYLRRCDEPENPVTLTPVEDCHAAGVRHVRWTVREPSRRTETTRRGWRVVRRSGRIPWRFAVQRGFVLRRESR